MRALLKETQVTYRAVDSWHNDSEPSSSCSLRMLRMGSLIKPFPSGLNYYQISPNNIGCFFFFWCRRRQCV